MSTPSSNKGDKLDLIIFKGRDFSIQFQVLTVTLGHDLSFSDISSTIREDKISDSEVIVNFSVCMSDPSNGIFSLYLPHTFTESITKTFGYYDILVDTFGKQETYLYGQINFKDPLTYY